MVQPKIVSLHIYPVKSLGGMTVPALELVPAGLRGDREFVITDPAGKFLTQRQLPRMAQIQAHWDGVELRLQKGGAVFRIPTPQMNSLERSPVTVWADTVLAQPVSKEADEFLSEALGQSVHLWKLADPRRGKSKHGEEYEYGFADQAPLNLMTLESLEALRKHTGEDLQVATFRPNIVVEGNHAWSEETWSEVNLNGITFEVLKPTSRCKIITQDPATGEFKNPNVLQALKNEVKGPQPKANFGLHLRTSIPATLVP